MLKIGGNSNDFFVEPQVESLVYSQEQLELLKRVKLLTLDVDGVMTDCGLYFSDDGNIIRRFNAKDGMGMVLALKAGIHLAIISAGSPGSIELRAKKLGVQHVYTAVADKLETLKNLCAELDISLSEVAHIGDDVNDLGILEAIGCPITVADGVDEVKAVGQIITQKNGGHGAVREICDALVKAQML